MDEWKPCGGPKWKRWMSFFFRWPLPLWDEILTATWLGISMSYTTSNNRYIQYIVLSVGVQKQLGNCASPVASMNFQRVSLPLCTALCLKCLLCNKICLLRKRGFKLYSARVQLSEKIRANFRRKQLLITHTYRAGAKKNNLNLIKKLNYLIRYTDMNVIFQFLMSLIMT